MAREISNSDDVIDSRDVIERIEELQGERDSYEGPDGEPSAGEWAAENSDDADELAALEALQEEAEDYCPDWRYGATLIRESYFTEYCKELLKDIGDLPKDIPNYIVIDWEATADNIRVDYTEVDFDGETYLVR